MIQIKDIDFRYPGSKHLVFRDFSLELKENNIYGLLGKNGTGKSTLLYLISGLLRQQQGTVLVDGISAQDRRAEMLKDIFMVPEEFELPNVSLATYVKMNQGFYPNFSQEVLDRCLKDFDLPLSLKLNELSMGQKKKVFMSFALATGTRFLLMDEPTNGLDIPSKSQFRKVIANNMTEDRTLIISTHQVHDVESLLDHIVNLKNQGVTILFVEHDMHMVRRISDWVVVMAEGRIIAEGPPETVMLNKAVQDAYLGAHHDTDLSEDLA